MPILYFAAYAVFGFLMAEISMRARQKTLLRETSNDKWLYLNNVVFGPVMFCFIFPIMAIHRLIKHYSK